MGGGNLAEAVALAISNSSNVELTQIYLRRGDRAAHLSELCAAPAATFDEPLAEADIYLLAVSDPAIGNLSSTLNFAAGALVAHTAGSTSIEALDSRVRRAVLYPLQSFSAGRRVDFAQIPIFVEGDSAESLAQISELAKELSDSVICIDSDARRQLHLSAVFACNFVNAMFVAGEQLVGLSSQSFEVLKPLIGECCAKACEAQTPRSVQTGPAVRGDNATMQSHIAMLEDERLKEIYQNISRYIWETLKRT